MISAVMMPPASVQTRSNAREPAQDSMDFLATLQGLTESQPASGSQPQTALSETDSPVASEGEGGADPTLAAAAAQLALPLAAGAADFDPDESLPLVSAGEPLGTPSTMSPAVQLPRVRRAPAEVAVVPLPSRDVARGAQIEATGTMHDPPAANTVDRTALPDLERAVTTTSGDALRGEAGMISAGGDPDASASGDAGAEPAHGSVRAEVAQVAVRQTLWPSVRAPHGPLTSTIGTPQWSQEFVARVSWLVDRGDQYASIRLSPEQLGPVEVRLAVREGEASIWFGAAQPETRAAIEQALPRLREMLAGMGLALADSGVFHHAPSDPQRGFLWADARRAARDGGSVDVVEAIVRLDHRGLIDDYA